MTVELFLSIAGFVAVLIGGAWALVKIVVTQFDKRLDERFSAIEKARKEGQDLWSERFSEIEKSQHRLERDFLGLKSDLPVNYVRREDHIRFETGIYGKLDALNAKLDMLNDRYALGAKLDLLDNLTARQG